MKRHLWPWWVCTEVNEEEFDHVNDFNSKQKKKLCPSLRALLAQQTQQSGIEWEGFDHSKTTGST